MTIRIAIAGASGRMGQMLIEQVLGMSDMQLVAALDRPDAATIGQDAGYFMGRNTGVKISPNLVSLEKAQVLIDFTRPEASQTYFPVCQAHGVKLVLGTTGFDAQGLQALQALSEHVAVVFSPNMSVGVNVTLKLLAQAGRHLAEGFDIEVIEAHHRHKVDAPSGTALKMGEVVAHAAGRSLSADAVYSRQGHTGPRSDREIGFSVIRGGDIVGDHTVLFAGLGERIEITHKSSSRVTYAQGALRAARFVYTQAHGLFDMQDVLGLKDA